VSYVTNNLPLFDSDFEFYEGGTSLTKIVGSDFAIPEDQSADWVVVIPTGSFDNKFYDAALNKAREWNARVALLSFETPNWFNKQSPYARSAMPTESWRQVVAHGGAVISIAREGIAPARQFFGEGRADLYFDYWHPSINDLAAAQAQPYADGHERIAAFVRTEDQHKGAQDLLRLDPAVFADCTLSLVFGRGIDQSYVAALARHLGATNNARIELHERISDREKFRLLASSTLLLFPSYFEGYGYPPVEAGWMGVPTVAYDLPLLHETVGDTAFYASPGDHAMFSQGIRQLRQNPPSREAVRAGMRVMPDTLTAGLKFLSILSKAEHSVAKLHAGPRSLVQPIKRRIAPDLKARSLMLEVSGDLRLEALEAQVVGRVITLRGRVFGKKKNCRLRFGLSSARIPDWRLTLADDETESFEVSGQIEAWPTDNPEQLCRISVIKPGGSLNLKATIPVRISLELLLERTARIPSYTGSTSQSRPEALICLEAAALFDDPLLALSTSAIAQAMFQAGIRSHLLLSGTEQPIPERYDPDFLPLVDTVSMVDSARRADRIAATLSAGGLVLAQLDMALPEAAHYDVPLPDGRNALVLLTGVPLLDAQIQALQGALNVQTCNRARRAQFTRNLSNLVILSSATPMEHLPHSLSDLLAGLQLRLPGLDVVLPARMCAGGNLDSAHFGVVGTVEMLGEAALQKAVAEAGSLARLHVGPNEPDMLLEVLLSARPDTVLEFLEDDTAGHDETAIDDLADRLATAMLGTVRTSLSVLLDTMIPGSSGDRPSRVLRISPPQADTKIESLPTLGRESNLCFTVPCVNAMSSLLEGWDRMDETGAFMTGEVAVLGFRIDGATIAKTVQLEVLLRSAGPEALKRKFLIGLNGRTVATVTPNKSGVQNHVIRLTRRNWSATAEQYLSIRVEEQAEADDNQRTSDVALLAICLSDPIPESIAWGDLRPDAERLAEVGKALPNMFEFSAESMTAGVRLSSGWALPEQAGCWTNGSLAAISFDERLFGSGPMVMALSATTFHMGGYVQRFGLSIGTTSLADMVFSAEVLEAEIAVPSAIAREGFDAIYLDCPDAVAPVTLGFNNDIRKLGLFLKTLSLIRTGNTPHSRKLDKTERQFKKAVIELEVCPGVLRLSGPGPVDPALRFQLGASPVLATPCALPDDRWEAVLRLSSAQLAEGDLALTVLRRRGQERISPLPAIEMLEFWPELALDSSVQQPLRLTLCTMLISDDVRRAPQVVLDQFDATHPETFSALGAGWSQPEAEFVWSDGNQAEVMIPAGIQGKFALGLIRAGAFALEQHPFQRQRICLDNEKPAVTLLRTCSDIVLSSIPLPDPGWALRTFTFSFPDARSPRAMGLNGDARRLSMQLVSLDCAELEPSTIQPDVSWISGSERGMTLVCLGQNSTGIVLELQGAGAPPSGIVLDAVQDAVYHPAIGQDGSWRVFLFCPVDGRSQTHRLISVADNAAAPNYFSETHDICEFALNGATL
jgi:glycosyltransferase involved in cell wall biosynthesis